MGQCCTISKKKVSLKGFDPNQFEQKVKDTIKKYKLFNKKDKVLVACSGGKDSTVVLYILKKLGYDVEAITIDAHIGCYTETNVENLKKVCEENNVKLHIISFRKEFGKSLCYIISLLKSKGYDFKSCHICGVLRRYLLNKHGKKLKPDVLVTGHNLDDEAQAILMNIFRGQMYVCARQGPKTGITKSSKFVQRVKPLYFCHEADVVKYSQFKQFPVNYGECPCSFDGFRREFKNMFLDLGGKREQIKENIVESFIGFSDKLKKEFASQSEIGSCNSCGEPSSGKVCNACVIVSKLKEKSKTKK